jgi:hypothetical protein
VTSDQARVAIVDYHRSVGHALEERQTLAMQIIHSREINEAAKTQLLTFLHLPKVR